MPRGRRRFFVNAVLAAIVSLIGHAAQGQDEAVTHQGRRYAGILRGKDFALAEAGKQLALEQIHLVRFPERAAPVPRCRLRHRLLLPDNQRLTGELLALGPKDVQFRIANGQSFTIPRRQLAGIAQPDGRLIQWAEDFEGKVEQANWLGKPVFSAEHVFSGQRSLLVDARSTFALLIAVPRKPDVPGRATLHFFDPGQKETAASALRFVFRAKDADQPLTLSVASDFYRVEGGVADNWLKATRGWHIAQVDWHGRQAKIFVDDYFLGARTIADDARLASLSFGVTGEARMWIDAVHLSEQVAPLKHTAGPPELDEIWLASGDQVFGDVTRADEREVVLEGRLGKRAFRWNNIRAIFFRAETQAPPAKDTVEVRFRSGPGVSADQLTGTITRLDDQRLLLRHAVLGESAVARADLERIRFPEPTIK